MYSVPIEKRAFPYVLFTRFLCVKKLSLSHLFSFYSIVYVCRFLKGTCDKMNGDCLLSHEIVKGKVRHQFLEEFVNPVSSVVRSWFIPVWWWSSVCPCRSYRVDLFNLSHVQYHFIFVLSRCPHVPSSCEASAVEIIVLTFTSVSGEMPKSVLTSWKVSAPEVKR